LIILRILSKKCRCQKKWHRTTTANFQGKKNLLIKNETSLSGTFFNGNFQGVRPP
jgi:hypothetical protein